MLNPSSPTQADPNSNAGEDINNTTKDVSMVDVSKADGDQQPRRRRSTLILTDEIDLDRMNIDNSGASQDIDDKMNIDPSSTNLQQQQQQQGGNPIPPNIPQQQQQQQQQQPVPGPEATIAVPVDIKWVQGGQKVYVTGSFTGWRKMIGLVKQPDNNFLITLGLPVGTHRFRFVVDNELRFSDFYLLQLIKRVILLIILKLLLIMSNNICCNNNNNNKKAHHNSSNNNLHKNN